MKSAFWNKKHDLHKSKKSDITLRDCKEQSTRMVKCIKILQQSGTRFIQISKES